MSVSKKYDTEVYSWTYYSLLNSYNLNSNGYLWTQPALQAVAPTAGKFIIGYTVFDTQEKVDAATYMDDGKPDFQSDIVTSDDNSYNWKITQAIHNIMNFSYNPTILVNRGMAQFQTVANLAFEETSGTTIGAITFAQVDASSYGTNPFNYPSKGYSSVAAQTIARPTDQNYGDIFFNLNQTTVYKAQPVPNGQSMWEQGTDDGFLMPGTFAYKVLLEEISHALGIDIYNGGRDGKDGEPSDVEIDNHQFTVTSYNYLPGMSRDLSIQLPDNSISQQDITGVAPIGLQILDILALQEIYGRNYNGYNAGNQNYGLGAGIGALDSNPDTPFIQTLWDGNGSSDLISVDAYSDAVILDLRQGHFSSIGKAWAEAHYVGDRGPDLADNNFAIAFYTVIEEAIGTNDTNKGDILIGNAWDNKIQGLNGDDAIYGDGVFYDGQIGFHQEDPNHKWGTDFSEAPDENGSGDDYLLGGAGSDTVFGGNGIDILDGGFGSDTLYGGDGDDYIYGSKVFDDATAPRDFLYGGEGDDYLEGNKGDDILDGGTGFDYMSGGQGHDTYYVDSSYDYVNDLLWDSTVVAMSNGLDLQGFADTQMGPGVTELAVSTGSGWIRGNQLMNTIAAGSGNSTIDGGEGADTMAGGTGNDVYLVDNTGDVVIELAAAGIDEVISTVSFTLAANFENLTLMGSYSLTGRGNELANTITGNSGTSYLFGGDGNDTYVISSADNIIVEYASEGTDTVITDINYTLVADNVENLILSGTDNLSGTGNSAANNIAGNSGDNTLDGAGGADVMVGGLGDDTYYVDNASDWAFENVSQGQDTVYASVTYTMDTNIEIGILTGSASINLTGNSSHNTMTGNSGVNTLNAGNGNDTLDGGAGADSLIGGGGNDTFIIDASDTLNDSSGTDTVIADFTYTLLTGFENLLLTGVSAINGTGNTLNNVITGNGAVNTLSGNDGNDTLDGGAGADVLSGGNGDDIFVVDDAGENLSDTSGTDTVQSSITWTLASGFENLILTGSDNINATGNSSANTLQGNSGTNTLTGGTGNDTYIVDSTADVLVENAGEGTDSVQSSVSWTLAADFENLTLTGTDNIDGTGNSDVNTLTGNSGNNTLDGGAGADSLVGGAGDDTFIVDNASDSLSDASGTDTVMSSVTWTLATGFENLVLTGSANIDGTGNSGNNTLQGNSGTNTLTGGAGNDTYIVDGTGDVIVEGASAGTDTVMSSATYTLSSNLENLVLTGSSNIDGTGNSDANTLQGNSGTNVLTGGAGNDTYIVDGTADTIVENVAEGTDTVQSSVTYTLSANIENLTLTGSANIDGTGNADVNVLTGNSGNNTLDGGAGADSLVGGAGDDAYIVDNASDSINEGTNAGVDTAYASVTYTITDVDVENLVLTGLSNINGTGNSSANTLQGNSGANTLAGGTGNDTYIIDSSDTVSEGASAGTDTVIADFSYTLVSNVENLILTGSSNINGTGNSAVNVITGNSGNNTLDGSTGADSLAGGAGDDVYIVDNANDVISENTGEGSDLVKSSVTYTITDDDVESLTLTGSSAIHATGNASDNTLTGNTGANSLDGGAGADTMIGGTGNDTYAVDDIGDVITENPGEGTDTVRAAISWTLGADLENLTLTGTWHIDASGNSGNNTLIGNSGNNTLDGAAGSDNMQGGAGDDTYIVSTGDTVTESVGNGTDTVRADITYTLGSNVENLVLTGASALNGTGNTLNNVIIGNTAVNTLTGNDGDDTLDGGAGADSMAGGNGNDVFVVDNVGDILSETSGTDTVQSSVTWTLATGFENLTLTGTSALIGTGNSSNNIMTGNNAASSLAGGTGDDTYIVGGAGNVFVEASGEGTDSVQSAITWTLGANIEILTLTGASAIDGTGNSLDNTLTGNSAINTLAGGTGDDTYVVSDSNDILVENSAEGTDTVLSGINWTLAANFENLTLTGTDNIDGTGNSVVNILTGNDGDNTLDGGAGADTMVGGIGNDHYVVDDSSDVIDEDEFEGTDSVEASASYTLSEYVEHLTLTGSSNISGTGNDYSNDITGNDGVNILTGNDGNDILDGGAGADSLIGGEGDDYYIVDDAGDTVTESADEGTDTVESSISYTLSSDVENLVLTGSSIIDGTGNSGDNTLSGNDADNTLTGGDGDDSYIVNSTGDVIVENASEGNDSVYSSIAWTLGTNVENLVLIGNDDINGTGNSVANILTGNGGDNTLWGDDGDDILSGGAGDDILYGQDDNDTLAGGSGTDTLIGGTGDDLYLIFKSEDTVIENSAEGTDTAQSIAATYTLADNVENLQLLGAGNISGTGNSAVNTLTGGDGDNTLDGGGGVDTMIGGLGNDTYIVDDASEVITENASEGTDTIVSGLNWTIETNVENLILTGLSNLNGTGNSAVNVITGNSGDNTLDGDAGADTMLGGVGNDVFIVDNVSDVVTEVASEGTDTVLSSVTYTISDVDVENLTLTGSSNINATGNASANILTGNSGDNTLVGGNGNDTLIGGAGADILQGGANDDLYIIDASDSITDTSGVDTVQVDFTYTLASGLENLILTGSSAIDGTGNTSANVITGNSAVNTLTGDNGNDTLDGGAGADSLIGGAGDDTFIVDDAGDSLSDSSGTGDLVQSTITWTLGSDFEHLTLLGSSNIDGTGNASVNIIRGNIGNNTLDGGSGADSLVGGAGDDTYIVDNASDIVTEVAGEGVDTVYSSVTYTISDFDVENLILTGGSAINATGNAGNNTLVGNSAANVLNGGTGNDTYYVSTGDTITDASGTDTVVADITWTLASGLENLILSGSSAINGTGNSSNNTLIGNSGVNTLTGNDGADTLDGGAGADSMSGGNGDDLFIVDDAGDILSETSGTDTVQSSVSWTLASGFENLVLTGSANIDGTGNSGANTLQGNSGTNTLTGGAGNDTYIVDSLADTLTEGSGGGTDTVVSSISYTLGSEIENLILAGSSNLDGTGNTLANSLTGNSGVNTLDGGSGSDTMAGGDGDDLYIVDNSSDVIVESLSQGTDSVQSSVTYTLAAQVENLTLMGGSAINGTGNNIDNIITGNSAANTLTGNGGDDTLDGGVGADYLIGGGGHDVYIVDDAGDVVTENVAEGLDTVQSSITWTLGSNFENLILTGASTIDGTGNSLDNTLQGNSAVNTLTGGTGNDTYIVADAGDILVEYSGEGTDTISSSITWTLAANFENLALAGSSDIDGTGNSVVNIISGNSGDNVLDGGAGADIMTGGMGDDTYIVDDSGDAISENWYEGTDVVQSSVSYTLSENIEVLTLTGSSNINGLGNDLDNTLIGNSGNNSLDGGLGDDLLVGGTGDDSYIVDSFDDVISENSAEGTDTAYASSTYSLADNVENLTLTGSDDIAGTGNDGANTLTGNSGVNVLSAEGGNDLLDGGDGNDYLFGGEGDDALYGGNGLDTMIGGDGADTFLFQVATAYNDVDVITDFNVGDGDIIDVSDLLAGYNPMTDNLTDFVKIEDDGSDSTLSIDRDGTGGTYGWVQVSLLTASVGLTNEAALVTNGSLVVS